MAELVTLSKKIQHWTQNVHFASPPPAASEFLPQPQLVKICGSASGDRENQQYYFGPVITKYRLQTGYKMHSAYKSLGAFETLASDLCINYHICTCTFYKHTSLFNFFRRSADMLLTSIKACLICSLWKGVYKCLLKITWTFLFSWAPVYMYTEKDQWLALMSIGFLLNNRPEMVLCVERTYEKNGIYSFMLVTCIFFYFHWSVNLSVSS